MQQSTPMKPSLTDTIHTFRPEDCEFPQVLQTIPDPPRALYVQGDTLGALLQQPCVAIVGSRKVSPYGQAVTTQLASQLARAGVVIVSGLAIGVDAIAHRATLQAGGLTFAVLASGLNEVYPAGHHSLAQQILEQGGALVSEYAPGTGIRKHHFIARNRLVSGLCQAIIITEAAENSGTLHTARFALEQGREVLAVPGNITSPVSAGTNNLIKAGAAPITHINDVFHALGLQNPLEAPVASPKGATSAEQLLIDLLKTGTSDGSQLLQQSKLPVITFNQTLTMLEINGAVRSLGGNQWALC